MPDTLILLSSVLLLSVGLISLAARISLTHALTAELVRKFFHVYFCAAAYFVYSVASQPELACLLFLGISLSVLLVLRVKQIAIYAVARNSKGELWLWAGITISMLVCWERPVALLGALAITALADSAAALVGRLWGRNALALIGAPSKTAMGSCSFLVIAFVVLVLIPGVTLLPALLIAVSLTLIELYGHKGRDNFFLPLVCGVLLGGM